MFLISNLIMQMMFLIFWELPMGEMYFVEHSN